MILVEPSNESIELAEKIQYMAQGLGIHRIRAILNKIEDEDQEEYVMRALSEHSVRFLGSLPQLKEIRRQNLYGAELTPTFCYSVAGMIARYLLDEAEMSYQKI